MPNRSVNKSGIGQQRSILSFSVNQTIVVNIKKHQILPDLPSRCEPRIFHHGRQDEHEAARRQAARDIAQNSPRVVESQDLNKAAHGGNVVTAGGRLSQQVDCERSYAISRRCFVQEPACDGYDAREVDGRHGELGAGASRADRETTRARSDVQQVFVS